MANENENQKSKKFMTELSKTISYALRHAPWEFELELDEEGWCESELLMEAMRNEFKRDDISMADVEEILRTSDKKRYEISGTRIRAYYGHSLPMKIRKEQVVPPEILWHGTSHRAAELIMIEGLKPLTRQYVHLSGTQELAYKVGFRKDRKPVILTVHAIEAHRAGIVFYHGNEEIWLADYVPPEFIEL
ncbi:MAG: RNA 2'-phosphotransferase [Thermoguttaceae bacterium]|nr:RNA 2'-phosphotransferase [Thermoguttaceae bacterium]